MVGKTVIVVGLLLFAVLLILRSRGLAFRRSTIWALYSPVVALVQLGVFILMAAGLYSWLFGAVVVSAHEAEYFAVQTMTTVRFGSALAPVSATADAGLTASFQQLTKWLMLPLVFAWAYAISAVIQFIQKARAGEEKQAG